MAKKEKIKKGDWAVHTYYGVGQIIGRDKKKLRGSKKVFYGMKFDNGYGKLNRYKLKEKYIRPIATKEEFKEALEIIRSAPRELDEKPLRRKRYILQSIQDGSLFSLAGVLRDLYHLIKSGKADYWSKARFSLVKSQFLDEWTQVSGTKKGDLEKRLKKNLITSLQTDRIGV